MGKSCAGVQNNILARFCARCHAVRMPQCVAFSGFLASLKQGCQNHMLLHWHLVRMSTGARETSAAPANFLRCCGGHELQYFFMYSSTRHEVLRWASGLVHLAL